MKPDWKDAPEWAKFLARDLNGVWYWYEKQPIIEYPSDSGWSHGGQYERAGANSGGWDESLEPRP